MYLSITLQLECFIVVLLQADRTSASHCNQYTTAYCWSVDAGVRWLYVSDLLLLPDLFAGLFLGLRPMLAFPVKQQHIQIDAGRWGHLVRLTQPPEKRWGSKTFDGTYTGRRTHNA
jgi:hypothetical protein